MKAVVLEQKQVFIVPDEPETKIVFIVKKTVNSMEFRIGETLEEEVVRGLCDDSEYDWKVTIT